MVCEINTMAGLKSKVQRIRSFAGQVPYCRSACLARRTLATLYPAPPACLCTRDAALCVSVTDSVSYCEMRIAVAGTGQRRARRRAPVLPKTETMSSCVDKDESKIATLEGRQDADLRAGPRRDGAAQSRGEERLSVHDRSRRRAVRA